MAWKKLCTLDEVEPDTVTRFDVDGVPVVVVRSGEQISATPPMCPHEEEPLEESGVCAAGVLTCAEHLWQWRLEDGSPCGPEENDRKLLLYPLKREAGDLLIDVEKELHYEYDEGDEFDF